MTTGVRRVIGLNYGWAHLPETISIHGGDPTRRLREPVPGVLCELDGGWLLLDTGYNDALIRDPALRARFHGDGVVEPELPAEDEDCLPWAFARAGVDLDEVAAVALSHLHYDHAGGLRHFAGRVPVHCQRRELDFGLSEHPGPERHGIYRIDFDHPGTDWRLADGPAELAPGIRAVPTYGHTPGHQSFVVDLHPDLADRIGTPGLVLAFDAADLQRNIDEEVAVGTLIDAGVEESVETIRRLKALAAEKGYRLVPGHDPDHTVADAVRPVPGPS